MRTDIPQTYHVVEVELLSNPWMRPENRSSRGGARWALRSSNIPDKRQALTSLCLDSHRCVGGDFGNAADVWTACGRRTTSGGAGVGS